MKTRGATLFWFAMLLSLGAAFPRPSFAGVTLFVTPLGADRWAVQYEADVALWSAGFIIDGATVFEFAGLSPGGDPGADVNAAYDSAYAPKTVQGDLFAEPMPSLLVNPHGGVANNSMGPANTRIDLGVATVAPGQTPSVRYTEIEALFPDLWASSSAFLPSTEITIIVDSGVDIPALPGGSAALLGFALLALAWFFVRMARTHAASP